MLCLCKLAEHKIYRNEKIGEYVCEKCDLKVSDVFLSLYGNDMRTAHEILAEKIEEELHEEKMADFCIGAWW